ncbi:MAG: hypothetical protein ACREQV_05820 [Candidatus Binatia bacterium]
MDREKLSIKELSIDELTTQAMQLLGISLPELHAVLGFQLSGYSRPARLADIISYHTTLQRMVEAQGVNNSLAGGNLMTDFSRGLDVMYEELKQDGVSFVEAVREELCKVLTTPEALALADRATASSVQITVLMVSGALRMPAQMDSLAATIAAIIWKSGLKDFCQEYSTKHEVVQSSRFKVPG